MIRKYYIRSLCITLLFVLASCGKTGDLYLPEDKPGKSASIKP